MLDVATFDDVRSRRKSGGRSTVVDLIRRSGVERAMGSKTVVPGGEKRQLLLEGGCTKRNEKATGSLALERPNEPLDDSEAAVLPHGTATATHQQNGQRWGTAHGRHDVRSPAPVGTVVRSTCQTWFGERARTRRDGTTLPQQAVEGACRSSRSWRPSWYRDEDPPDTTLARSSPRPSRDRAL